MAITISIDVGLCNGYGNCVVAAPEVFDLDPDTNIAFVIDGRPQDADNSVVQEAVADCPARAIKASYS